MATVTGLTAARMLQIEAESVVGGYVNAPNGHLILTKHDGSTIDAGYIISNGNFVDIVSDQAAIAGLKTFTKKVSIEMADASTPALRIGQGAALDGLNITPYGAASVVLASGADTEMVAGALTSTARSASASQIEMLNSGVNWFADTGLTPGNVYARTKRMSLDPTGLTITAGGASVLGNNPAQTTFYVNAANAQTSHIIDLDVNGARRLDVDNVGNLRALGPNNYFGPNSAGASGAAFHIQASSAGGNDVILMAESDNANSNMTLRQKGTGVFNWQNNIGTTLAKLTSTSEFVIGGSGSANGGAYKLSIWGSAGANTPVFISAAAGSTGDGQYAINLSTPSDIFGGWLIGHDPVNNGRFKVAWEAGSGPVDVFSINTLGQMQATGSSNYFGSYALSTGTGTRIRIGDLGDTGNAYVIAEGNSANVGLIIKTKGTGVTAFKNGADAVQLTIDSGGTFTSKRASDGVTVLATELVDGGTGSTQVYIRCGTNAGMTLQRIGLGAADSGGAGFRMLRVPN